MNVGCNYLGCSVSPHSVVSMCFLCFSNILKLYNVVFHFKLFLPDASRKLLVCCLLYCINLFPLAYDIITVIYNFMTYELFAVIKPFSLGCNEGCCL